MSLRKLDAQRTVGHYEQTLLPSWTRARDAVQRMRAAHGADEAAHEEAAEALAEKYPSLKEGR